MKGVPVLARWSVVVLMLGVFGGTMLEAAAPEPQLHEVGKDDRA